MLLLVSILMFVWVSHERNSWDPKPLPWLMNVI